MIDPVTLRRWGFALLFLALSALIVFARMLPLGGAPGGLPPPDLTVLIGFAWVLRRPDFMPVLLFAAVLLMTDMLFLRPPGVASGLAVIGLELLRGRVALMRGQPFPVEWATVAVVLALMLAAERLFLALFVVDQASIGLSLLGLVMDIGFYPLVVVISVSAFRVRRPGPSEHPAEVKLA